MSICLCGPSAEKILDLLALKRLHALDRAGRMEFETCRAGRRELRRALSVLPPLEQPVHVLVPEPTMRVRDAEVRAHVWSGPVVEGALIRLAPSVYALCPEFNAALLMRGAASVARALVLMSYCGIFSIDTGSEDGFVRRPQLTTVDRLRDFAVKMQHCSCSHALSRAAELTLERSRSPLESSLAVVLTAPCKLGGFAVPRPELNAAISLGETGCAILGRRVVEADLVWRGKRVVLEVNGRLRHEGRFGDDLTRSSALESQWYSVRFVTAQQFRSARQMLVLGRWLRRELGMEELLPERSALQKLIGDVTGFAYPRFSLRG